MKPANGGEHRGLTHDSSGVLDRVDDACMATAADHDQTVRGIDNDRCILEDDVFDEAARGPDLAGTTPVAFGVVAPHGPGEPDPRQEFSRAGVLDEGTAETLVLCLQRRQSVAFRPIGPGSWIEDAARHVRAGESPSVLRRQLPSERHEPGGVVGVIVRNDEVRHA